MSKGLSFLWRLMFDFFSSFWEIYSSQHKLIYLVIDFYTKFHFVNFIYWISDKICFIFYFGDSLFNDFRLFFEKFLFFRFFFSFRKIIRENKEILRVNLYKQSGNENEWKNRIELKGKLAVVWRSKTVTIAYHFFVLEIDVI